MGLGVLCTGLAYILYFRLAAEEGREPLGRVGQETTEAACRLSLILASRFRAVLAPGAASFKILAASVFQKLDFCLKSWPGCPHHIFEFSLCFRFEVSLNRDFAAYVCTFWQHSTNV